MGCTLYSKNTAEFFKLLLWLCVMPFLAVDCSLRPLLLSTLTKGNDNDDTAPLVVADNDTIDYDDGDDNVCLHPLC